jgi:hypothetical protein
MYGGRYRIVRDLGHGGMGIVYEATDTVLNRSVALKIVLPSLPDRENYQARFAQEAAVLAKIRSRHIVGIHEYGEHDDTVYFVTELFPDGDLQTWLQTHGPLERRSALMLVAQVCEALADAHAVQVIHRDVKPGNVLLWRRPEGLIPYLCDFGIAVDGKAGLTRTGTLIGSPAYMAPERHFGHPADERGDLYSVGCLLWACLTGESPYLGTDFQVMNSHINEPVPALGTGDPIDDEIDALLASALEKDPAKRVPTADRMRQQVLGLVSKLDAAARSLPPIPPRGPATPAHAGGTGSRAPSTGPQTVVRNVAASAPPPPPPPGTTTGGEGAAPAGAQPPAEQGDEEHPRRRLTLVATAVAALLVVAGLAYAATAGSDDEHRDPATTGGDSMPTTTGPDADADPGILPIQAPPAPEVTARPGYRSVAFVLTPPAEVSGVSYSLEVDRGPSWKAAGTRVVVPTEMGGRRACLRARTVATSPDGSQREAGDPVRACGTAKPATVAFLASSDPCVNSVGGPCTYYDVRVTGFPAGVHPDAKVRRVNGESWCGGCGWDQVKVGKDGRGYLAHDWKISRDEGQVILDVMGVTGRFHLYYRG